MRTRGGGCRIRDGHPTAFKVNVYVAALYVAKTSGDASALPGSNTPSELILQFVRDVGADDIRKGWSEGFEKRRTSCPR